MRIYQEHICETLARDAQPPRSAAAVRIRVTGEHEEADGMAIEPFALHDNLMLAGGVIASGGCVIVDAAPDTERYTSLVAFERCAAQAAAALLR